MLRFIKTIIGRLHSQQRGQILIMAVAFMVVGLGAIVISVDAGFWLRDRRDAQNDADAAALAAAQELPDTAAATDAVYDWAAANGVAPEEVESIEFEDLNGDGDMDLVRVRVLRQSSALMAQVFGAGDPDVGAHAAAARVRASGACLMPWAIDAVIEDPSAFDEHFGVLGDPMDPETLFTFQLGSDGDFAGEDGSPGNFGALAIYGTGTVNYRDAIINECGSRGEDACDSDEQTVNQGDTLSCPNQTGELGKNTATALNERDLRYYGVGPNTACDADSYEQAETLALTECALSRVVPIAVIKDFPAQGSSESTDIYAVDNFYIAGWDRQAPWGQPQGMVWGYLLQNELVAVPAWEFNFGAGPGPENPFAPVAVVLVE